MMDRQVILCANATELGAKFVIFVLVVITASTVSGITLGTGPQNTQARLGDTVELVCDVNYRDEEVIRWHHKPSNDFLTYNRVVSGTLDSDRRERYSIQGSEYWHVFNLRIENLKRVDDGVFSCGYIDGGRFVVLGSARLIVVYPPSKESPSCAFSVLGSNAPAPTVGSTVDLTCSWPGGYPDPTGVWYRGSTVMYTQQGDGFVWTRWKLTEEDNGREFTCNMNSEALSAPRYCTAMPLRIPPQAVITPSVAYAAIGDTVDFQCRGFGLPRIAAYSWEFPESLTRRFVRRILPNGSRLFRLYSVQEQDDNLVITCHVETSPGLVDSATAIVKVVYPTTTEYPTTFLPTTVPTTRTPAQDTSRSTPTEPAATGPQTDPLTPATPQPSGEGVATSVKALQTQVVIAIAVGAGVAVLLLMIVTIIACRKRSRNKNNFRHEPSLHLVNSTYDTVVEGGRILDDPILRQRPEYQTYDTPRPVAAVTPMQVPDSPPQPDLNPSVRYAKANKQANKSGNPLYDKVPDEDDVDLGIERRKLDQEPTYVNQGLGPKKMRERDPQNLNAEGLTYADLDLDQNGRLHSKKNHTVYAKLK